MADIAKGLPVRTEDDADQKVQNKIVDFTTPTQGAEVDTDKNLHIEAHGNDPAGTDKVIRLSELGDVNSQGDYDVTNNTKPSSSAVIVHDRVATPGETDQNVRVTGIANSTVHSMDVAIRDENGVPFSGANPLPVTDAASDLAEVADFDTVASVAALGTSNHDYSIPNGKTFLLKKIILSSSSRAKWELQVGDGALSEVFATKAVWFTSEDIMSSEVSFDCIIQAIGTANTTTIRIIRTNRDDDDAVDLYSTILALQTP